MVKHARETRSVTQSAKNALNVQKMTTAPLGFATGTQTLAWTASPTRIARQVYAVIATRSPVTAAFRTRTAAPIRFAISRPIRA